MMNEFTHSPKEKVDLALHVKFDKVVGYVDGLLDEVPAVLRWTGSESRW